MNERVLSLYLCSLFAATVIGVYSYKQLDNTLRVVALLLVITSVVEISTFICLHENRLVIKNIIYHLSSIIELILCTSAFLNLNKPHHYKKLMIVNIALWPTIGILNIIFLQPFSGLNTNILMLESFGIITMSLFSIYRMLKNNMAQNIFLSPYFWLCAIWLVQWSSTFFFWAFIKILYKDHWAYINLAMDLNNVMNIIVYSGMGIVLFCYHKMIKTIENN